MVPGTGDSSDGTTVHFNALRENERDGPFLSGGVLYLTFTSYGDTTPYHGWLVGFNPTTLNLVSVYNSAPVGAFAGHMDIGSPGDPSPAGNATFSTTNGGTYTLTASGSDIWTNTDHMQYLYRPLVGDGSIIARLASASTPDFWTKAGLMTRDDLTAGAANDFMLDTPNPFHQEPVMQFRDADGGQTGDTDNHFTGTTPNVPTPIWLRLDRSGNTFTGYWAVDNNGTPGTWNLMSQNDPHTTVMPTTVYVGLALTAHSNGNMATATFDHVTVTGTTAPLPPAVARLTDGGGGEAGTVFTMSRVLVSNFTTTFTFRQHDGTAPNMADGLTFIVQSNSPTALGPSGGGLGYGPDTPGAPPGIPNSIAVKFDLFSNAGEGTDSTGLYIAGASPTVPAIDMTSSGVILQSQDVMQVTLTYDGTTLTETITDATLASHPSFTTSYTVDIPAIVGSNLTYVGFGGGTGGLTSVLQDIQTWAYQFTEPKPGSGANSSALSSGASPVAPAVLGGASGTTTALTALGNPDPAQTLVAPWSGNPGGAILDKTSAFAQDSNAAALIDSVFPSLGPAESMTASGRPESMVDAGYYVVGGGGVSTPLAAASLGEDLGSGNLTGPF